MLGVHVLITRYVDDAYPGFVEFKLTDVHGREWSFIEKVPVVTLADLDANSIYPTPTVIACQLVQRRQDSAGREVVTIDTELPWHIESTTGQTTFEVLAEQLTEFGWGGDAT